MQWIQLCWKNRNLVTIDDLVALDAKAFFNVAVDRNLINTNPFRKLKTGTIAANRDRSVTPAEAQEILEP